MPRVDGWMPAGWHCAGLALLPRGSAQVGPLWLQGKLEICLLVGLLERLQHTEQDYRYDPLSMTPPTAPSSP